MNHPHFAAATRKVWLFGVVAMLVLLFAGVGTVFADPPPTPLNVVSCPTNLNSCTANDLPNTLVGAVPVGGDTCSDPDDTITVDLYMNYAPNSTERYDLGVYYATDGGNVNNGNACVGAVAPIGGGGVTPPGNVFQNLEADQPTDTCGDISSSLPVTWAVRLQVQCRPDTTNNLVVGTCNVWDQNGSDTCTELAQAGTGSKCLCQDITITEVPVPSAAKLTVNKVLSPANDPGLFNLQIDGGAKANVLDQGNGGTTGEVIVGAGTLQNPGATHTVGETEGTGTVLTDYLSAISCVKKGTQTVVASGSTSGPLDVPFMPNDDIVCTITNTKKAATIIIKKIALNQAGTAYCPGRNFGFSLDTTPTATTFDLTSNSCAGSPAATYVVMPGTYTIAETDSDINTTDGWWLDNVECRNAAGALVWTNSWAAGSPLDDVDVSGAIAHGEVITCVFTNRQDSPLGVALDRFAAQASVTDAGVVQLVWQTVSDVNARGFNVHRAQNPAGPWKQLNAALIPVVALGSTEGHAYTWSDTTATAKGAYWYRLDDVSLNDAITSHAPAMVVVNAPLAVRLLDLAAGPVVNSALPLAAISLSLLTGFAVARRRRR